MTFVNKHLIFLKSLKEPSGGNCVKIFECRAFSLLGISHCVVFLLPKTRSRKYAPMDSVFRYHKDKAKKNLPPRKWNNELCLIVANNVTSLNIWYIRLESILLLENTKNKPPDFNLLIFTNWNILSTNKYMGQKKFRPEFSKTTYYSEISEARM